MSESREQREVLREKLAAYSHDAWAGWMKYMFSKGTYRVVIANPGDEESTQDEWIMPLGAVERWQRQMNTPYAELSEAEKESDRAEADRMIEIMERKAAPTPSTLEGQEDRKEKRWYETVCEIRTDGTTGRRGTVELYTQEGRVFAKLPVWEEA